MPHNSKASKCGVCGYVMQYGILDMLGLGSGKNGIAFRNHMITHGSTNNGSGILGVMTHPFYSIRPCALSWRLKRKCTPKTCTVCYGPDILPGYESWFPMGVNE